MVCFDIYCFLLTYISSVLFFLEICERNIAFTTVKELGYTVYKNMCKIDLSKQHEGKKKLETYFSVTV